MLVMKDAPHKADEFFTQEVIADGNHIQIIVNGKTDHRLHRPATKPTRRATSRRKATTPAA